MGLDAVITEIKEKARAEADAIIQEADAKKTEILTAAQTQVQLIKTDAEENAQKTLMDEVQAKTLEQICALPESFHKQAIASLLKKAQLEIQNGTVTCAARDAEALRKVLSDSEFAKFTAGDPTEIDGGIIVESADGMLQVDYSYHTFLNQVWESGLKDASDILFH
jgi:V/A-type H+-transporting ATPase subunit E